MCCPCSLRICLKQGCLRRAANGDRDPWREFGEGSAGLGVGVGRGGWGVGVGGEDDYNLHDATRPSQKDFSMKMGIDDSLFNVSLIQL